VIVVTAKVRTDRRIHVTLTTGIERLATAVTVTANKRTSGPLVRVTSYVTSVPTTTTTRPHRDLVRYGDNCRVALSDMISRYCARLTTMAVAVNTVVRYVSIVTRVNIVLTKVGTDRVAKVTLTTGI
jgi:hypothetical protein